MSMGVGDLDNCKSVMADAKTQFASSYESFEGTISIEKSPRRIYARADLLKLQARQSTTTGQLDRIPKFLLRKGYSGNKGREEELGTEDEEALTTNLHRSAFQSTTTMPSPGHLTSPSLERKSNYLVQDASHPLHQTFELLPSGRRFRVPVPKKSLYNKSFHPNAIHLQNSCF